MMLGELFYIGSMRRTHREHLIASFFEETHASSPETGMSWVRSACLTELRRLACKQKKAATRVAAKVR